MKTYRVELIESKTTTVDVRASNEDEARNIAEEEYYAAHSVDDNLSDFHVENVTELTDIDSWEN